MAELVASPGKSGGRNLNRLPVRVDLTALVDLAFLLITFFMLTTTLQKVRSLPLVMPAPGPSAPVAASTTMTICLGKNNQAMYFVGMPQKPLTAPKMVGYGNAMEQAIIQISKEISTTTGKKMFVIISPSDHSVYKNLVSTLDEMNITGVASYAIAPIPQEGISLLKQKGAY
jgi:biopolymer transport protein ExbD